MVKNFGGKHGKKIARKNANSSNVVDKRKLRYADNEEELYGIVKKCNGNSQFLILCNDMKERLCTIRSKFTGRNKKNNLLCVGSWVLIGLRNWETIKADKKEKCDLLVVYNNNEKHFLLQECKTDLSYLIKQEHILTNINYSETLSLDSEQITFSDNLNEDEEKLNFVSSKIINSEESETDEDDYINPDDI